MIAQSPYPSLGHSSHCTSCPVTFQTGFIYIYIDIYNAQLFERIEYSGIR